MLTILIPTILERKDRLIKLTSELMRQYGNVCTQFPELGVLHHIWDNSKSFADGGLSVGAKRNALKNRVETKYFCYLDDDDDVSPDYVETLLRLCQSGADICTFQSLFTCDTYWSVVDMSLHYPTNEQATPEYTVRRKPWHICPVRTELAQDIDFPDKNNAEDWEWMDKVLVRCATQAKTNRIIHNYKHSASVSEVDKIERNGA